jgi:hypothetical protein
LDARARLSPDAQVELNRVVTELSDDPERFSERAAQALDGDLFVYAHPHPPFEITYRVDRGNRVITLVDLASRAVLGALVVVSYSHADRKWLTELKKFLKPLVQKHRIRIWDDTAIEAGVRWRDEIGRFFSAASIAIFLVSQDFIASDFISEHELPPLLARGKRDRVRLLWIAVRPGTYDDLDLSELQALNDPARPLSSLRKADRERDLTSIRQKIIAAVERASGAPR